MYSREVQDYNPRKLEYNPDGTLKYHMVNYEIIESSSTTSEDWHDNKFMKKWAKMG